ncbi:MAG: hypothetical protein QOF61_246 [Acidobacteriota bacterium]|jgi:hypothetical protein|nr:hypothetical protein [Acidobacteriota bacterium]
MLAFVGLVLTAALADASWSALIKLIGEAVARHSLFRCVG